MARKPDVALLIMVSGSFVDKHQSAHIKKKICAHKISKLKIITVLRQNPRNQSQIQGENLFSFFFLFLEITTFLRQKSRNQSQIKGENLFYFFRDHYVFETKIKKLESVVNNINFTPQKKSLLTNKFLPTHIQLKIRGTLLALTEIHLKLCSFYGSLTQKGSLPLFYSKNFAEH